MNNPYINPLSNEDFPDPSVIEVQGEGYFAYATHDKFSPSQNNILVKRSRDLVNWSEATGALLAPPVWAKNCQRFWCPHVVEVGAEFRLYYAAEPDTNDGMCLAMASSRDPLRFIDCGHPIGRIPGSTYQMIDPCLFVDPVSKKHFLYYGSAHEPIKAVEVGADGKTFTSEPVNVLYPGKKIFERLREGAFISYKPAHQRYFLWASGDSTWEPNGYAVTVFWSPDPLQRFEKIPGDHLLLQPNKYLDSPGNISIINDAAGNEWIFYHAVDPRNRFIPGTDRFLRKMCMDRINYTADGWPYIHNSSPSHQIKEGPVTN